MKMVKKVLLGLGLAAAVLALAGCALKDDPKGVIKGGNGSWSVNYTFNDAETADDTYRAYKPTGIQHAGALIKVTFNDPEADAGASKMGVIFDLEEQKVGSERIRSFNIIGIGQNGEWYVSRFTNVKDIQEYNFGTELTGSDKAIENEIVELGSESAVTFQNDVNLSKSVYVWYQAKLDGYYDWKILKMTPEQVNDWKALTDKQKQTTPPVGTVVFESDSTTRIQYSTSAVTKEPQHSISVYAMIKGGKTLNGSWKIAADYLEAEDIEVIE